MRKRLRHRTTPAKNSVFALLAVALILSATATNGAEIARWNLANAMPGDGEHLLYRLSYRGLFTSFIWKDLADIAFISAHSTRPFQRQPSCDLRMKMSTENYALSEMFHATRYEWHSTIDPTLRHIFLVEETDAGKHAEKIATWVNWPESRIELFRQRERIPAKTSGYFFGSAPKSTADKWEKDGAKPLPAFLNKYPLIDDKYTPLIHDKSINLPALDALLDPLSLIYAARWHDYKTVGDLLYPVTYADEIKPYRVRSLGLERIEVAGALLPAHKMEIQRANREEAEEQGFMIMWLSDDEWRVPLQFEIKSTFGRIKIHIVPASLRNSRKARHCTTLTRQPTTAASPARTEALNRK